jgi:hypothetical protein
MVETAAIPTLYKGIRYRSRLEAKWGAFFELLELGALYEPFDLKGWIPDFSIGDDLLVEVKPVSGTRDPLFVEATHKIENSGWEKDVQIVSHFWPTGSMGWIRQPHAGIEAIFAAARRRGWIDPRGLKTVLNWKEDAAFYGDLAAEESMRALWREAGNLVQWRRPA